MIPEFRMGRQESHECKVSLVLGEILFSPLKEREREREKEKKKKPSLSYLGS